MGISLVGHGTGVGNSAASISVSAPSGIASGDILILVAGTYGADAIAANNGYAELYDSGYVHVYWKRTTGTEGSTTVSGATNSVTARISAFRGCDPDGSPLGAESPSSGSSSGATITSMPFSTTANNEMVIVAVGIRDNNSISGSSAGNLTDAGYTDFGTNLGSDTKCAIIYGSMPTAGSIGTVTLTQSSTDAWTVHTFALAPFLVTSATSAAQSPALELAGAGTVGYSGTGALTLGAVSLAGTGDDQISIERKEGEGEYAVVATRAWTPGTWTDTGPFTPGETYTYRAKRIKAVGTSPYSEEDSALMPGNDVTGTGALTLGAVTMEGAATVSGASVESALTLAAVQVLGYGAVAAIVGNGVLTTGTAAADGDGAITQDFLSIERKTGSGGTYAVVKQAPIADEEWTDVGPFENATDYYYRARRYRNEGVSAYATEDSVTYGVLASAGTLTIAPVSLSGAGMVSGIFGTGALTLGAITAQGTGGTLADAITIERKTGEGEYALMHVGSFAAGSWTDASEFVTGTTYTYRAFRTVDGVTSAWSNEATASFDSVTGTGAVTIGFVSLFGTQNAPTLFVSQMTGLTPGTHYYVRAYAINADGTGYGSDVEFTTDVTGSGTLTLGAVAMEGTGIGLGDGSGALTIGAVNLSGIGFLSGGGISGGGQMRAAPVSMEGSGLVLVDGTGTLTLGAVAMDGTGSMSTRAGALTTATVALFGVGHVTPKASLIGVGTLRAGAAQVAGTGSVWYTGSGRLGVAPVRMVGYGTVIVWSVTGTGALTVAPVSMVGVGTVPKPGADSIISRRRRVRASADDIIHGRGVRRATADDIIAGR